MYRGISTASRCDDLLFLSSCKKNSRECDESLPCGSPRWAYRLVLHPVRNIKGAAPGSSERSGRVKSGAFSPAPGSSKGRGPVMQKSTLLETGVGTDKITPAEMQFKFRLLLSKNYSLNEDFEAVAERLVCGSGSAEERGTAQLLKSCCRI